MVQAEKTSNLDVPPRPARFPIIGLPGLRVGKRPRDHCANRMQMHPIAGRLALEFLADVADARLGHRDRLAIFAKGLHQRRSRDALGRQVLVTNEASIALH